jgi:UDP-glucose 4-epimerase
MDLCDAYVAALDYLCEHSASRRFNLGNGSGFSVTQVIETVRRVAGKPLAIDYVERRAGDPAILVADATRARILMGWAPKYADLETIVAHAWQFEKQIASSHKS